MLPSIYVTLSTCLPLFTCNVHLTGMISLYHEQGLLWLKHKPLRSLALHFETNCLLRLTPIMWVLCALHIGEQFVQLSSMKILQKQMIFSTHLLTCMIVIIYMLYHKIDIGDSDQGLPLSHSMLEKL